MTDPISVTFLRDVDHGGDPTQPATVAGLLAGFIAAAAVSVDVAIYDFRLSDTLGAPVVAALVDAADRGVTVRVGYDAGKPAHGTAATFAALQADPAPAGTAAWVSEHFADTKVATRAISAAPQLMHSKYVVVDATGGGAGVWTGSTNFTDDAWTHQENTIITVTSAMVAAAYAADFDAMWTTGVIKGTGVGDTAITTVGSTSVGWDFAPGDGAAMDAADAAQVDAATTRVVVAAMVLTSHTLLAALVAALARGVVVSGIYDAGQMNPIVAQWKKIPADAGVLADFQEVAAHLAAKHSAPYSPTGVHNFMHNKTLVTDSLVTTGSYNFSANAERNAENQLHLAGPTLTDAFAAYITTIAAAYRG